MRNRRWWFLLHFFLLTSTLAIAQQTQEKAEQTQSEDAPVANPARPTVSTPATLTPVGYLQFETGILSAWHSPGVVSQTSLNEVIKYAPSRWLEAIVATEPYAHSHAPGQPTNAPSSINLGVQAVVYHGEGATPTVALSYLGQIYGGTAPDLDIASPNNSAVVLLSGDVKGFHYDGNALFNEVEDGAVRRAAFGQTLSVSHPLSSRFGVSGEIWHFTQPFLHPIAPTPRAPGAAVLHGNAIGNLWAVDYVAKKTLVLDCGFDHGFTSTSTQWEVFAGFTYLLPHKLPLHW
jgi:hypothetical protein